MSTVPEPAGDVATICVPLLDVIVPTVVPKFTAVAPLKFAPLRVIDVPPAVVPELGEILVRPGAGT